MNISEFMMANGHEQLSIWTDQKAGLRSFVAIHDRTLGPSLGGVRIWPHQTEEAAITDVLRLSRAMTYKSAVAGLPLGGGKAVIIADPNKDKTEAMFRSFGRFVESLGGRYITTEDVGASPRDLEWVSYETSHVVGLPESLGGSGNPAGVTGFGLFQAMRACAKFVWGAESLNGCSIAIQGFGNVAQSLSGHLLEAGANLTVTDIVQGRLDAARAMSKRIKIVSPEEIIHAGADIFAPCALGAVVNRATIPLLRCAVVCGAANNQLETDEDAERLAERGILYGPDYVANAGGVINVYHELGRKYNADAAMEKAAGIYDTMLRILQLADEKRITPAQAADTVAEERLDNGRKLFSI
jgi:leucine dehydrogenase